MKDKPVTVEDYEKYGKEFLDKYFWIAKELGEGAKAEDILKIMESLAALVMKKRVDDKLAPFGFLKKDDDRTEENNDS